MKLKSNPKSKLGKFITLPLVDSKSLKVTLAEQYCSDINLNCDLIRTDGTKMRVYVDRSNLNFVMNTFLGGQQ